MFSAWGIRKRRFGEFALPEVDPTVLEQQALTRDSVIWLDPAPSAETLHEFDLRGLRFVATSGTPSADKLLGAKAIVKSISPRRRGEFRSWVEGDGKVAIGHGLLVVIPVNSGDSNSLSKFVESLNRPDRFKIVDQGRPFSVPEVVARFSPGPFAKLHLTVESSMDLSPEEMLLVRRSFSDCKQIKLKQLSNGLSGRSFRAYARLDDEHMGSRRPLPFFVKFDKVDKIRKEWQNYRRLVESFIPFSQRPRLDENRTLLGYESGILVGAFVEQTEKFISCLQRGDVAPIGSLFDEAFRGWRLQAYQDKDHEPFAENAKTSIWRSLTEQLYVGDASPLISFERIRAERVKAASEFGEVLAAEKVKQVLEALPAVRHRRGPIHADLHPGNIFVHSDQAVVIDFEKTRLGPLSFDAAVLETALAFDSQYDNGDFESWESTITQLYSGDMTTVAPPPADSPEKREWLWSSVRQIRVLTLANCITRTEYPTVLAIALFRRACFQIDKKDTEQFRRTAFGYYLACKLIQPA